MTNLHTLKLSATAIGATAPRHAAPTSHQAEHTQAPPAVREDVRTASNRGTTLRALLALELVATLAAVEATGAIRNHFVRLGTGIAAIAVAAAILAGIAIAFQSRRPKRAVRATAAPAAAGKGFSATKAVLLLLMTIGIAAYFGGAGTFAGFTA